MNFVVCPNVPAEVGIDVPQVDLAIAEVKLHRGSIDALDGARTPDGHLRGDAETPEISDAGLVRSRQARNINLHLPEC